MAYPKGTVPTTVEVHPTPIYEFLVMGAVTIWLWRRRDRVKPGELIGWWAVLAGIERFLVEFIRRNDDIWGPFSLAQFVSVLMIVVGGWWLLRVRSREPMTLQSSATVPSPSSSAPRKARAAAASSSSATPTDL
jgi:phosphatidylglycerol:prolipoprotein diacylglycerol transferase